ncbi:sel1 repeat family protein [Halopseudomonas nanhaiensis]|uniref:tetratricopeptide repeat protein n=1 Tax=Halopseudomonas nanhaiensis TaxID=2830842 RepID=UPI001CBB8214|nr:tetratricopeptide repeat protein [Halopseudomonas nanhaiensis]UAW99377.1 sel1 repeat family protein [Halopseudomonas nanhaiensis]
MRVTVYLLALGMMMGLGGCTTLPDRQTVAKNSAEFVNRAEAALAKKREQLAELANDLKSDSPTARRNEVNSLMSQPRIDPLTAYLRNYANDPRYSRERALIRAERDKRCDAVGDRYSERAPTQANLERFRRGYRLSCPTQIAAFARRVNPPQTVAETAPRDKTKRKAPAAVAATPAATPSTSATEARQPEKDPAPARAQSTQRRAASSDVASASASNCYLLYAIKNFQEAQGDCLQAARDGDAKSQHHLADIAVTSNESDAARHWAEASANQGYPAGQMLFAQLLQQDGDETRALQLLKQAADDGLTDASYEVGQAYLNGEGTQASTAEAMRYFKVAAERDHVPSQLQLSRLYASSDYPDAAESRRWLTRAAEQESAEAQYALGMSYSEGDSGQLDYRQAYVWLSRAMLNGDRRARAELERIAPELTAEQLGEAQAQVQSGRAGRRP